MEIKQKVLWEFRDTICSWGTGKYFMKERTVREGRAGFIRWEEWGGHSRQKKWLEENGRSG